MPAGRFSAGVSDASFDSQEPLSDAEDINTRRDITDVKLLGMRGDGGEYIRMSKRLLASSVVGAMLVISAVLVVSLIGGDDKPDITNDVPEEGDEQLPDDSQDDTPVDDSTDDGTDADTTPEDDTDDADDTDETDDSSDDDEQDDVPDDDDTDEEDDSDDDASDDEDECDDDESDEDDDTSDDEDDDACDDDESDDDASDDEGSDDEEEDEGNGNGAMNGNCYQHMEENAGATQMNCENNFAEHVSTVDAEGDANHECNCGGDGNGQSGK